MGKAPIQPHLGHRKIVAEAIPRLDPSPVRHRLRLYDQRLGRQAVEHRPAVVVLCEHDIEPELAPAYANDLVRHGGEIAALVVLEVARVLATDQATEIRDVVDEIRHCSSSPFGAPRP